MKNNYVKLVLMALVAMMCFVPVIEAKNAPKKKKEKKKFEWVMPEKMTGIEDFDKYLLTCDTLWNRITTYRDSIHFSGSIRFWFRIKAWLIMTCRFGTKKGTNVAGRSLSSKGWI